MLQFIIPELVIDRRAERAGTSGENVAIARREDVAEVVEPGQASRRLELLRQRYEHLRPARDLEIAAERPAEIVLGAQTTLFVSAYGLRTTAVELPVRRQRGGVTDVHAIGNVGANLQREPAE